MIKYHPKDYQVSS